MTQIVAELMQYFRRNLSVGANADFEKKIPPEFYELLARLDDPHLHLPPVIHVAGTNGKGSTAAFLRAMLEAAGKKVHVYTSPHLLRLNERIRIAGVEITDEQLAGLLEECTRYAKIINARTPGEPNKISYFEVLTAVAFTAFARFRDAGGNKADYTILEVGLGGRWDATNVVEPKHATVITTLSFDHCEQLGYTIREIAGEKGAIMRRGVPCFSADQPVDDAAETLQEYADEIGAPLFVANKDWRIERQGDHCIYSDRFAGAPFTLKLPLPGLEGLHQVYNAGLAVALLRRIEPDFRPQHFEAGLRNVTWPGRLQLLDPKTNKLAALAEKKSPGTEVWLDGGHNDSAGDALALHVGEKWQDGREFEMVIGMQGTKDPGRFFKFLARYITAVRTVKSDYEGSRSAKELAKVIRQSTEIKDVKAATSLVSAFNSLLARKSKKPRRILVAGSLYFAGQVLGLKL